MRWTYCTTLRYHIQVPIAVLRSPVANSPFQDPNKKLRVSTGPKVSTNFSSILQPFLPMLSPHEVRLPYESCKPDCGRPSGLFLVPLFELQSVLHYNLHFRKTSWIRFCACAQKIGRESCFRIVPQSCSNSNSTISSNPSFRWECDPKCGLCRRNFPHLGVGGLTNSKPHRDLSRQCKANWKFQFFT